MVGDLRQAPAILQVQQDGRSIWHLIGCDCSVGAKTQICGGLCDTRQPEHSVNMTIYTEESAMDIATA